LTFYIALNHMFHCSSITSVNSFEFQPCGRSPQAEYLRVSLNTKIFLIFNTHKVTAWTTRVSNPVWYPCFCPSASVIIWLVVFTYWLSLQYLRILPLHWKCNIPLLYSKFIRLKNNYIKLFFRLLFSHNKPPTCPLRPVLMSNTHPLRITATAGTKLVGISNLFYIIIFTSFTILQY
jgi:hypothetical protein